MDFERVLRALLVEFRRQKIRYAVIGGFALGVLGYTSATMDLDFLVHRDDLEKLHERLTALGYGRLMQTENVSHYHHRVEAWGGVDFVHAFREISLAMLARAKTYKVFGGKQTIRVANPEDVIGQKVQAMVNDPDRKAQEVADIEMLMRLYGAKLDWPRIEDFLAESASKYHHNTKHIRVTKGDSRWHRGYVTVLLSERTTADNSINGRKKPAGAMRLAHCLARNIS